MYTKEEHRKRVRARFLEEGLDNFDPVHALELLLFYAIPQKDTKQIARDLLNRFETFHGVLEASADELQEIKGVGENTAAFLSLINATGRYYEMSRAKSVKKLKNVHEYGEFLVNRFMGRRNEVVFLLCLDAKGKVLCCRELGEGDVISANLPIRRVVEIALSVQAATVVLAHNHPSGLALPSREDIAVTLQLQQALQAIGITLADHLIVAENEYVSLLESGYLR